MSKIPLQFLILHINEKELTIYGPYEMQKYFHYIHNKKSSPNERKIF